MRFLCLKGRLTQGTFLWSREVSRLAKRISREPDKKTRDVLISAMAELVKAIQDHEARN